VSGSTAVLRVLVADDDPLIRSLLQNVLAQLGYSHQVVESGASAIEECGKGGYSVLILDLEIGEPNGFKVIARLRAAGDQIPVILMSGSFSPETLPKVSKAQGVTCIAKPFDIVTLEAAIKRSIGARHG
jgi:CheY-like chemotaxis protein